MGGSQIIQDLRLAQNDGEYVADHCLMTPGNRADFIGFAMFGDGKGESAAAKIRAIRLVMEPFEDRLDLLSGSQCGGQNLGQRLDDTLVACRKIGGDKVILGWEVPVERRLCYPSSSMMRSMPTALIPSR